MLLLLAICEIHIASDGDDVEPEGGNCGGGKTYEAQHLGFFCVLFIVLASLGII